MDIIIKNQIFIVFGLIAALGILFWQNLKLKKKLKSYFGNIEAQGEGLENDLLRRILRTEAKIDEMKPHLDLTEAISKMSIQKVGFLRFNPFQDTGGDNSFSFALLDWNNNGIIFSSLYTREGVRVYGKSVEKGRSKYPLSEEEKRVLEQALNSEVKV